MENLNLLLTFTADGEAKPHVKRAARVSLDGSGGLLVYDAATGVAERISLSEMRTLRIERAPQDANPSSWVH